MDSKIILSLLMLVSACGSAHGLCRAGQMTKLTSPVNVDRHLPAGETLKLKLETDTEVHVISVKPDKIEIYATNDLKGTYINGLGEVDPSSQNALACQ